jgi:hypothetical protein
MSGPAPSYSVPGYAVMPYSGPAVGQPVSAPVYAQQPPPNELPYPGGENIPNPGVPLSQGLPAPQPLGPPTSTPVGLPK